MSVEGGPPPHPPKPWIKVLHITYILWCIEYSSSTANNICFKYPQMNIYPYQNIHERRKVVHYIQSMQHQINVLNIRLILSTMICSNHLRCTCIWWRIFNIWWTFWDINLYGAVFECCSCKLNINIRWWSVCNTFR